MRLEKMVRQIRGNYPEIMANTDYKDEAYKIMSANILGGKQVVVSGSTFSQGLRVTLVRGG